MYGINKDIIFIRDEVSLHLEFPYGSRGNRMATGIAILSFRGNRKEHGNGFVGSPGGNETSTFSYFPIFYSELKAILSDTILSS